MHAYIQTQADGWDERTFMEDETEAVQLIPCKEQKHQR